MKELFVLASCIFFLAFLVTTRARRYFAIFGWTDIILFLFAEVPYYLSINNFLYPLLAVLAVPFLFITAKYLLAGEPGVEELSRAAAVGFLIYAPFAYTPLGDWLISVVVGQTLWMVQALGYSTDLYAWNMVIRNGFRVEIILACTGIQAIAIDGRGRAYFATEDGVVDVYDGQSWQHLKVEGLARVRPRVPPGRGGLWVTGRDVCTALMPGTVW